MNTVNRLRWEHSADPTIRVYKTTVRLHSAIHSGPTILQTERLEEFQLRRLHGRTAVETVGAIMAIPGVVQVTVDPYQLAIKIGGAYEWSDGIHDTLISVLVQKLYPNVQVDVGPYTVPFERPGSWR